MEKFQIHVGDVPPYFVRYPVLVLFRSLPRTIITFPHGPACGLKYDRDSRTHILRQRELIGHFLSRILYQFLLFCCCSRKLERESLKTS